MLIAAAGCAGASDPAKSAQPGVRGELRILVDQPPLTLNPRSSLDANGQRLGAFVYRALTRIDANLEPRPDLSESWEILALGKTWKFKIRPGLQDHRGQPIDAQRIVQCLEQYRDGKPVSAVKAGLPYWKSTRAENRSVILELEKPDPYLARNLSLIRYFTSDHAQPCGEPRSTRSLVGSGAYRPATEDAWETKDSAELFLQPIREGQPALRFLFVKDDVSRTLRLLRRGADAIQSGLSLSKTRWLQKNHPDDFAILEREGVNVSYLAFNLKDPTLSNPKVRRAIALAIDRKGIVEHKMLGFGRVAGSFLSPLLPESHPVEFAHDPEESERLLDQAGFPRAQDGVRLRLKYRTTPVREGLETALLFQDLLKKVGIELTLDVVEPAVFLSSIKKGKFQLYSSRWIGVSDGSILYRTLRSGQPNNRVRYENAEMDALLEKAMSEVDPLRRKELLKTAQVRMMEELPYFPLWYWSNALVVRKDWSPNIDPSALSLSGGLEPLTRIHPGHKEP